MMHNEWFTLVMLYVLWLIYGISTFFFVTRVKEKLSRFLRFLCCLIYWFYTLCVPLFLVPMIFILLAYSMPAADENQKAPHKWRRFLIIIAVILGCGLFLLELILPSLIGE